jgi:hypothetical protein
MQSWLHRILPVTPLGLLAMVFSVIPVYAAAPRIILVSGAPLLKPVLMSDWEENLRFMGAFTDDVISQMVAPTERSYISLALFWGPDWEAYGREGKPMRETRK